MTAVQIVERYLETWNETDPDVREAALASVWAEEATYVDPLANVAGRDAISDLIGAVQQQVPGHTFRLVDDDVDAHHNVMRFWWSSAGRRRRLGRDRIRRRGHAGRRPDRARARVPRQGTGGVSRRCLWHVPAPALADGDRLELLDLEPPAVGLLDRAPDEPVALRVRRQLRLVGLDDLLRARRRAVEDELTDRAELQHVQIGPALDAVDLPGRRELMHGEAEARRRLAP